MYSDSNQNVFPQWSSLSEGGETTSQGYCGDLNQELSLSGLPGPQPQQAHHLVSVSPYSASKRLSSHG